MEEESPQVPLASVFTVNTPLTPLINVIVFISHKGRRTHRKPDSSRTRSSEQLGGNYDDNN